MLLQLLEIENNYSKQVHDYIWQDKINLALLKSIQENTGNVNVFDPDLQSEYEFKNGKFKLRK